MTELIINGRFLCQRSTGVQRVSHEFVLALERLIAKGEFPDLRARLIAPRGADFAPLRLIHVATEHVTGGAGYYWEQVALPMRAARLPLLCLGNAAPVLGLIAGGRVAVMLHDQSYRLFPEDYSRAYRLAHCLMGHFIIRRARPLITVSQTEAETIRRSNGGRPARITVAPNGSWFADRPASARRPATGGTTGFVLHVGGFSDRKNIDGVFAAAKALAQQGIATWLVGQPNSRSEAFLASLDPGLRSLIRFTGYVDNDVLGQLYRDAVCLMYPSFYEASGLPPSEAMSSGCPVVVSDLPALRERCGSAALYCNPHDHQSIVARVVEIVRDPERAAELSARGLDRAKQFTWENQARIIMRAVLGG